MFCCRRPLHCRQLVVTWWKNRPASSAASPSERLQISCETDSNLPSQLLGDPLRLRQVLVNLIGNAIKFTEKGSVRVTAQIESERSDAVSILFSVRDTGPAIPEDKHRLIFEAFRQADGSTTRKHGGSGLGLTICSRLVEMMGGRLWVESKVGEGNAFHFTVWLGKMGQREPKLARHLESMREPGLESEARALMPSSKFS
jgi:two-component system, sensor histidine kinase and response regulator